MDQPQTGRRPHQPPSPLAWTTAAAPALTPSGLTACSIQSGPRARPCPSSAQKRLWLPCPWGKSQSPTSPMDPLSVLTPYSPRLQPHGPPRGSSITHASGPLHQLRPLPGPLSPGSTQPTPSLPVCLKSQQHPPRQLSLLLLHAPPQQLSNTLNTVQLHRHFSASPQHGISLFGKGFSGFMPCRNWAVPG